MFFLILGVSTHVLTVEHCRNDSLNLRKNGECSATQAEGARRSHSWYGDKNHVDSGKLNCSQMDLVDLNAGGQKSSDCIVQ